MAGLEQTEQTTVYFSMLSYKLRESTGPGVFVQRKLVFQPLKKVLPREWRALQFIPFFVFVAAFLPTVLPQEIDFGLSGHMKPADRLTR